MKDTSKDGESGISLWTGFYRKSIQERKQQLAYVFPSLFNRRGGGDRDNDKEQLFILPESVANTMIENCIGTANIPLGLGLNFIVNEKPLQVVPMAVEEPSVIAAVSGAAKLIASAGGFVSSACERNIIYAQIQLLDIEDGRVDSVINQLEEMKTSLIDLSNKYCPTMKARGGGVVDITCRKIKRSSKSSAHHYWLVVHVHIDVCDAMGANCASTVAEGLAPFLQQEFRARIGFRIVSNLNPERLSKAEFAIPFSKLAYKGIDGEELAKRIVESYEWACDDPYRAVTHNKGIMNGIDAVAIATGQDWRAIEASCHAWACLQENNTYQPLTRYAIEERNGEMCLVGSLSLPLAVGTKGGVLKSNPQYEFTLGLLGWPNTKKLAQIMVCVGLAQNFAALRALSSEGIQKGHMALHAQNIAIAAGAPSLYIAECVSYMIETNRITQLGAKEYLDAHHLRGHLATLSLSNLADPTAPSMFYFEDVKSTTTETISLNIAFKTLGDRPLNILFANEHNGTAQIMSLFGDKSYEWVTNVVHLLEKIKYSSTKPGQAVYSLSKKLKFLSLLLNILARKLFGTFPKPTKKFLKSILSNQQLPESQEEVGSEYESLRLSRRTLSGCQLTSNLPEQSAELELRKSSLFRPELIHVLEEIVAAEEGEKGSILAIGLPLFLSIWQVFECRCLQWVSDSTLLMALLSEQRSVVASIISCAPLGNLDEILNVGSKRMQVLLFLYCDAVRFEDYGRIENLRMLGYHLEKEQMATRDVSLGRLNRDLLLMKEAGKTLALNGDYSEGINNTFLLWLHLKREWSLEQIFKNLSLESKRREMIAEFMGYVTRKSESDMQIIKELRIFSFEAVSSLFMSFYNGS